MLGMLPPMGTCPPAVAQITASTLHLMIRPGYMRIAISASWSAAIWRTSFWPYIAMTHCSSSTKVITGWPTNWLATWPGRSCRFTTVPFAGA